MIQLSIALTYLFGFLAAISVLLFGASFSRRQRQRFPLLKKLDGKQVHLFVAAVVFLALNFAGSAWKDFLTTQASLEHSQGPGGEVIQKATPEGFEKELEEGSAELGVTGLDRVLEYRNDERRASVLIEDLEYGRCEFVLAVPDSWMDVTSLSDMSFLALEFRQDC